MDLHQKSDLLHSVALSAENDLKEEIKIHKNSEEEDRQDRYKQAEELDLQVIDLEKMTFSAKDLNSFSALSS